MNKICLKLNRTIMVVFGVALFGLLVNVFFVNQVNAEIILNSASSTNFTGTGINIDIEIPDGTICSDPLLIVNMANYGNKFIGSATYDSVNMEYVNYQSERGGNYAYILNPNVGNNNLYISVPDGGWKNLVWSVFCGVDSLATSTVQGGWGTYYSPEITNVNIETDGSLMFSFLSGRQSGGDYALTPKFSDTLINIAYNAQITGSSYGLRDIGTRSVGWNTTNFSPYLIWGYLVFKPSITEFCGDTICNGDETCSSCSADCGTCSNSNIILYADYENYDVNVGYLFNDVDYNSYPILHYIYSTSSDIADPDYIRIEVCNDPDCYLSTAINFDDGFNSASTSEIVMSTSSAPYGQGYFALSNDHAVEILGSSTSAILHYKVIPYYQSNLGAAREGGYAYFSVFWYGTSALAFNDFYYSQMASSSTTTDAGIANTFLLWGSDFLKGFFTPIFYTFEAFFPFNVPVIIGEAWFSSENQQMPANSSVFSPLSENGDITIDLPIVNDLVVFGPSVLISSTTEGWYSGVRDFSTYLFYFLFALLVIYVAYKVFNIMEGRDDSNFNAVPDFISRKDGSRKRITYTVRSKLGKGSKTWSKSI